MDPNMEYGSFRGFSPLLHFPNKHFYSKRKEKKVVSAFMLSTLPETLLFKLSLKISQNSLLKTLTSDRTDPLIKSSLKNPLR